jgi:hypothetical protein
MELKGKQGRVLKDLKGIDEHGGELKACLERGPDGDFFRLQGWKGTQGGEPLDLTYTIGAAALEELKDNGWIGLEPAGSDRYGVTITPKGLSVL